MNESLRIRLRGQKRAGGAGKQIDTPRTVPRAVASHLVSGPFCTISRMYLALRTLYPRFACRHLKDSLARRRNRQPFPDPNPFNCRVTLKAFLFSVRDCRISLSQRLHPGVTVCGDDPDSGNNQHGCRGAVLGGLSYRACCAGSAVPVCTPRRARSPQGGASFQRAGLGRAGAWLSIRPVCAVGILPSGDQLSHPGRRNQSVTGQEWPWPGG